MKVVADSSVLIGLSAISQHRLLPERFPAVKTFLSTKKLVILLVWSGGV